MASWSPSVHGAGGFEDLSVGLGDLLLDADDEVGDFMGGLGRAGCQLGEFVGEDGEAGAVFSGAGGFNGGIESEEIGLLGQFLDEGGDAADGRGLLLEELAVFHGDLVDGLDAMEAAFGTLHGVHAVGSLLAGAVAELKQAAGAFGDAVDGGGHLVDGGCAFADPSRLDAGALDHALEVDAHLMHGAGDLIDAIGGASRRLWRGARRHRRAGRKPDGDFDGASRGFRGRGFRGRFSSARRRGRGCPRWSGDESGWRGRPEAMASEWAAISRR